MRGLREKDNADGLPLDASSWLAAGGARLTQK